MFVRSLFRFHYAFPQRMFQTQFYQQNKQFFDSISNEALNVQQFQKLRQQYKATKEYDAQIGILQVALDNGIMKEKLGEIREMMSEYKKLIESSTLDKNSKIHKHDLADFYEKEALLYLRECKMQESFVPFKQGFQQFIELADDKNEYIIRRIDQILETMIMVIEDMGQIEQAREHLLQGLKIFEDLLGKQSEKYIVYLNKLANTYLTIDNQKAIQLHKEALQILGEMNEENFKLYLKTAIELMIVSQNQNFDQQIYDQIDLGLEKYGNIDTELTVYYHVIMSHIFQEKKDFEQQGKHLLQAFKVYQNEKSSLLINLIAQKSLALQNKEKNNFFQTLINDIDQNYQDELEIQYYKCRLIYLISKEQGIKEFQKYQERMYNQKLTQYIVDFTQFIAQDGLKNEAISILKDYPEYSHLIKGWQQQN